MLSLYFAFRSFDPSFSSPEVMQQALQREKLFSEFFLNIKVFQLSLSLSSLFLSHLSFILADVAQEVLSLAPLNYPQTIARH